MVLALSLFLPVPRVSAQVKEAEEAAPKAVVVAFENPVKADMEKKFLAFVGEFRATVEELIKEDKLTDPEKKAFAHFRVLRASPEKDGVVTFTFLMDPWQKDVSYSMADYFARALGKEAAQKKIVKFQAMLAGPQQATKYTEH